MRRSFVAIAATIVTAIAGGTLVLVSLTPSADIAALQSPLPSTTAPSRDPAPIAERAADFRVPFSYVVPTGLRLEPGPEHGHTHFERRLPPVAGSAGSAGLIVQAIGGGRADNCVSASLPLPINVSPEVRAQEVLEYLRSAPGLIVSEPAPVKVGRLFAMEVRVTTPAASPDCPEFHLWAEGGPDPLPPSADLRMIVLSGVPEPVVLTVYGEDRNPTWDEAADNLIGSIEFDPAESWPAGASAPQPWTGIVRAEPEGEPAILPMPKRNRGYDLRITDATDGVTAASLGLVDIVEVETDAPCYRKPLCANFTVAGDVPTEPMADPRSTLVGYGLVIDRQGDGIADLQVGVDNAYGLTRSWKTDLHSGATESSPNSGNTWVPWLKGGGSSFPPFTPPDHTPQDGYLGVGWWLNITEPLADPALNFYVFAAAIRDGRIVAVDFAPDHGWLAAASPQ
jgi:hypothetical protein